MNRSRLVCRVPSCTIAALPNFRCSECLLLFINGETAGTHVDKQDKSTDDGQCLKEVVFKEVPLWMGGVDAPPVVGEHIEDAQNDNEEDSRPFGFETNSDHAAGGETKERNEHPCNAPCTLDDESEEQEDQEDTAGKQEVFLAVIFTDRRKPSEELLSRDHRFAENHDESTDDAQVAEEEVEVEDEAVSKTLNNNYSEETTDSVFCEALRYDGTRSDKHGNDVHEQEEMRNAPREVSVSLEIPDLVIPLGHNSQCILQESDNDQKTADGRQMGFQRLRVDFDIIFDTLAENSQFFDRVIGVGRSVTC